MGAAVGSHPQQLACVASCRTLQCFAVRTITVIAVTLAEAGRVYLLEAIRRDASREGPAAIQAEALVRERPGVRRLPRRRPRPTA